jgi:hypothetical protein
LCHFNLQSENKAPAIRRRKKIPFVDFHSPTIITIAAGGCETRRRRSEKKVVEENEEIIAIVACHWAESRESGRHMANALSGIALELIIIINNIIGRLALYLRP